MLDEESKPVAMEMRPGVVAADDAAGWAGQALSADQRAHGLTTVVAEMGHAMERERASRDRERRAWKSDQRMLLDRLNATREALGAVGRDFHKSAESLARDVVAERDQLRLEAQAQRRRADECEGFAERAESELEKIASKARASCPGIPDGASTFGAICIVLAELEAARAAMAMAMRDAQAGKPKRRKGR